MKDLESELALSKRQYLREEWIREYAPLLIVAMFVMESGLICQFVPQLPVDYVARLYPSSLSMESTNGPSATKPMPWTKNSAHTWPQRAAIETRHGRESTGAHTLNSAR